MSRHFDLVNLSLRSLFSSSMSESICHKLSQYHFVLGSTSPRRLEILQRNLGIEVSRQLASDFAEDLDHSQFADPKGYVEETARHKYEDIVSNKIPVTTDIKYPCLVLTADTIVSCGGQILEKPLNVETQRAFFKAYADSKSVSVITTVVVGVVGEDGKVINEAIDLESTELEFDACEDVVDQYIDTKEGLDVAGGFKYQEKGGILFPRIRGDYYNVVGLPVHKTYELLKKVLES